MNQRTNVPGNNHGSTLLVSLALLVLLTTLGFLLLQITRQSRQKSRAESDQQRARILAESGFEWAIMMLRETQKKLPDHYDSYSASEDIGSPWYYGATASNRVLRQNHVPLERAHRVSFDLRARSNNEQPGASSVVHIRGIGSNRTGTDQIDNDGDGKIDEADEGGEHQKKVFGISGKLPATYDGGTDSYSLRIEGTGGKIYVNGPVQPHTSDEKPAGLAPFKIHMLNNLGQILAHKNLINVRKLGTAIDTLRTRTKGKLQTLDELKRLPKFQDHPGDIDVLKGYLTTESWVDVTTLHPGRVTHPRPDDPNLIAKPQKRSPKNTQHADRNTRSETSKQQKKADSPSTNDPLGGTLYVTAQHNIAGFDPQSATTPAGDSSSTKSSNVTGTSKRMLQPRSPININTAPLEVIQATLMGIQAQYLKRHNSEPAGVRNPLEPRTFLGPGFTRKHTIHVSSSLAKKLAHRLQKRSRELVQNRGYGFSTYNELNNFIYALDSQKELKSLSGQGSNTSIPPVRNWGVNSEPRKILAIQQAVVANANPNSRLPHTNPNFSMGIRFGDTSKADLSRWTTEFSFSSNGIFRIESLGRVVGSNTKNSGGKLVAQQKISSYVEIYKTSRISTQKGFVQNQLSEENNSLQFYPENLRRHGQKGAAAYDGYIALATKDWKGPSRTNTREFRYNETLSSNGRAQENPLLSSGGEGNSSPGRAAGELLNDGVFIHDSRRYGTKNYRNQRTFGHASAPGGIDEFVRHDLSSFADASLRQKGAISMWVKPAWFGTEFPGAGSSKRRTTIQTSPETPPIDPGSEGTRTLFSLGSGKRERYDQVLPHDKQNQTAQYAAFHRIGAFVSWRNNTLRMTGLFNNFVNTSGTQNRSWPPFFSSSKLRPSSVQLPLSMPETDPYIQTEKNEKSWFSPGRWHFVTLQWDKHRSILSVDGREDPNGKTAGVSSPPNSIWTLFIGSNRFHRARTNGFPLLFDGTIDDVKIFSGDNPYERMDSLPDRYVREGIYRGKMGKQNQETPFQQASFASKGTVLHLSWTSYLPDRNSCDTRLVVSASNDRTQSSTSLPGVQWNQEQAGRGIPLSHRAPEKNRRISVRAGDTLPVEISMISSGSWITETPILDSITIQFLPEQPEVLSRHIE